MKAQTIIKLSNAIVINQHSSKPIVPRKGECFYSYMIEGEQEWLEVGRRFCDLFQLYIGKDLGYPKGKQFDF